MNRKLKNHELNRLSLDEFKASRKTPIIMVLDNVRSLNNIGSVFRTGDAFAIEAIYLCGITATPPNKDIRKTALGAEDAIPWKYFERTEDAILELKKENRHVISIEQAAQKTFLDYFEVQSDEQYAIVFGNEVKGIDQAIIDLSDRVIEIPQIGTKHSLNISVSVGVVLWEFYRQISRLR